MESDSSDTTEKLERRIADLEKVISEAICFPSAGLPDHQIRWLHDKICGARDSHALRQANHLLRKAQ